MVNIVSKNTVGDRRGRMWDMERKHVKAEHDDDDG